MKVAQEYRLQTTAGAAWERDFRSQQIALARKEVEVAAHRERLLSTAVQEIVSRIRIPHGEAKQRRKLALHTNTDPDAGDGDAVRVWLRDEWSCAWKEVLGEARGRGMEDPVLHVYLPKRSADQLKKHIVDTEAARHVLDQRGAPDSMEGQEARESMKSRRAAAEAARDAIVRDIIRSARVLQGGGGELHGDDLQARIETGAEASLARLFPRFPEGDHRAWGVALKRARDGSDAPLVVVGWDQAVADHPVAREVLDAMGGGARGGAIRKQLLAAPYGWPQDAVDAALVALHGIGHLTATRNGHPLKTAQLDQTAINTTEFRPEKVRLTRGQFVAIRSLFGKAGVRARGGEEAALATRFLAALHKLASEAGGNAPLPAVPAPVWLDELGPLTGNEQLLAIYEARDEIEASIAAWERLAERARKRSPVWELATALSRHAIGKLGVAEEVAGQLDAIRSQRSLLDEADHVSPCVAKLADRTAVRPRGTAP